MIRSLLNIIYPPSCLVCAKRIEEDGLCASCISAIRKVKPAINNRRYRKIDAHYSRVFSVCVYDGILREAIALFKYKGKLSLAKTFAKIMIDFAKIHMDMDEYDIIVPVPLSNVKLREREFNQALLLAEPVARSFNIPISAKTLQRKKATPPQSGLKKIERLENLSGAFGVGGEKAILKKRVLLIDDVFTTGATANESAKALLAAGAKDVSVLTLARGE